MIRVFNQYVSVKSLLLILFEDILMAFGLLCGARVRFLGQFPEFYDYIRFPTFAFQAAVVVLALQLCFYYSDLYSFTHIRRQNEDLVGICQAIGTACVLLGLLYYVFPDLLMGRGVFFIGVGISGTLVFASRLMLDRAWKAAAPQQRLLVIGTGELALTVAREVGRRGDLNLRLVGLVGENASRSSGVSDLFGYPLLGSLNNLESITAQHHITRIVVALSDRRGILPIRELVKLRVQGLRVEEAETTISSLSGRVWLAIVKPSWFVFCNGFRRSRFTLITKRCLDLAMAAIGLLICLPVMVTAAVAIRLDSEGPVVYRQTRVGRGGKVFDVLKFRSMRVDAEKQCGIRWASENDPRITRLGRFLRRSRLDELPQFVNVLKGEMSFVGPRPERPYFVEILRREIPYYDERHSVRPGLTGWAQVRYDYGASVEDALRKLEYDLFYLQNMSALFDLAIIFATVRVMITGRGAR